VNVIYLLIAVYYEQENLEKFNYNQIFHLGQYLIVTLNYFRECVSAFVESNNLELQVKVWIRLNNIVTLQKTLVKHFESFVNLPSAYGTEKNMTDDAGPSGIIGGGAGFSGGASTSAQAATTRKVTKKKSANPKKTAKPKKAAKKKKNKRILDDDDDDEEDHISSDIENGSDDEGVNQMQKDTINLEDRIQPKIIFPYIRRLDSTAFSVLIKYGFNPMGEPSDYYEILLNLSQATQSKSAMRKIQQFNPETLALLLSEMKRLDMDDKCEFKVMSVKKLQSSLFKHIDTISTFYLEASQVSINLNKLSFLD
jgi:hypothetical protein